MKCERFGGSYFADVLSFDFRTVLNSRQIRIKNLTNQTINAIFHLDKVKSRTILIIPILTLLINC